MKKCLKISANLWSKAIKDEKEVYIEMDIREFAKQVLGIDYRETEDVDSIDLEIEEIEIFEKER